MSDAIIAAPTPAAEGPASTGLTDGALVSLRRVRVRTLQWTVGAFTAIIGAQMLIVPHQFGASTYDALRPNLLPLGLTSLLVGLAMLLVTALRPVAWLTLAAPHLRRPDVAPPGIWPRHDRRLVRCDDLRRPCARHDGSPPSGGGAGRSASVLDAPRAHPRSAALLTSSRCSSAWRSG